MGQIEYWNTSEFKFPQRSEDYGLQFKYKIDSDLFIIQKQKEQIIGACLGNTGEYFAMMTRKQKVVVFEFKSGRQIVELDESASHYESIQIYHQNQHNQFKIDSFKEVDNIY